jgi:phage terminase large subunit-like protein
VLLENQVPRLFSSPPFFTTLGQDAVDLAAYAGLFLDPWQAFVLEHSMGQRRGGNWSSFEVGLLVPRQNGKGAIIEARQLAAMFLTKDPTVIYSAHQFKTAKAMYRRIKNLVADTPDLNKLVKGRYRQSNEETGIELDWGRLQFVARSSGSGRGLTGDTIFFDEAYNLDGEMLADMLPTLSAVPNPQVWYCSSAGMDSSEALARVRERGIAGSSRMSFFEWSAAQDVDLDDESEWFKANPSMGVARRGGVSLEWVREVERPNANQTAEDHEKFARERLGIWAEPGNAQVISDAAWAGAKDPDSLPNLSELVFAVDVEIDRSSASLASASLNRDGRVHVEHMAWDVGTTWAADKLIDICKRRKPVAVVLDAMGPAGSLLAPLHAAGIDVKVVSSSEAGRACGAFYDAVVERTLAHKGQPLLDRAIQGGAKRTLGDAWAWKRKDSITEISPLVACTLAHYGWITRPEKIKSFVPRRLY